MMKDNGKKGKEGHVDLSEEEIPLEKNDPFALMLSGMLMIGLPCLILIMIIMAAVYLVFLR
ncbi:MAG: hypothetical protein IJM85_06280 [Clostridia bacterium]|nr:hypothetical protein [Clostridia bacterium]